MSDREYPIHPRVGVGAVVIKDNKVLLVRRGVAPSKGLWAIPGGGLELGETLQQGAEREILEETGIAIRAKEPVYSFDFIERDDDNRIRFHYVIVDLLADYIDGEAVGGDDAAEARFLSPQELSELNVSKNTLRLLRAIRFISE
ncbi:MAG: NUDIX hydrolase [Deltaproteobacteria bacterium]|nr:NUDIX hydrolase [Deltaproteobacteria bacterium]